MTTQVTAQGVICSKFVGRHGDFFECRPSVFAHIFAHSAQQWIAALLYKKGERLVRRRIFILGEHRLYERGRRIFDAQHRARIVDGDLLFESRPR